MMFMNSTKKPYSLRSEWSDIKPIHQDDGPNPVCVINYSEEFVDVMGYFRAILAKDERSERAWNVMEDAIKVNPANYTAWHFRRILIDELKKDLEEELDFLDNFADPNPKNYQLWHHRRVIAEKIGSPERELLYTEKVLTHDDGDNKNYHAWSHRQWVVKAFKDLVDLEVELDFIKKMLVMDVRNNSAWNHRWFITSLKYKHNTASNSLSAEHWGSEIRDILEFIRHAISNPSPWAYIRGIIRSETDLQVEDLSKFCEEILIKNPSCVPCLATLIEINVAKNTEACRIKAKELCYSLSDTYDCMRKVYWKNRGNSITTTTTAAAATVGHREKNCSL